MSQACSLLFSMVSAMAQNHKMLFDFIRLVLQILGIVVFSHEAACSLRGSRPQGHRTVQG
jgi:hypothetical protein